MFGLGLTELVIILVIAFFIFGGKKLPEIGSGLGKAIGSFRDEINGVREVGVDLKKSLPGVQEAVELKESIDDLKNCTKFSSSK